MDGIEQTPEQKRAEERSRRNQECAEKLWYETMLSASNELTLWQNCSFPDCRRARCCQSKKFTRRDDVSYKVRMLSESIMPACTARIWYHGLQDTVVPMIHEVRAAYMAEAGSTLQYD